jgi:hypothetical protein
MATPKDTISAVGVDDKVRPFFNAKRMSDSDEFKTLIAKSVAPESNEKGTHSLAFWQESVRQLSPDKPEIVVFLTDGWEENATKDEIAALRVAGHDLSEGNVKAVYLIGLDPKTVAFWKSAMGELGNRLHISGPVEKDGIDMIHRAAYER